MSGKSLLKTATNGALLLAKEERKKCEISVKGKIICQDIEEEDERVRTQNNFININFLVIIYSIYFYLFILMYLLYVVFVFCIVVFTY